MKKYWFYTASFFISKDSSAQRQANIWHFGNLAGIDFNSGVAVAISGPIFTQEGCASVCDSAGNLLFSTDGITIYNSAGSIMDDSLNGDHSTTQSAIIVPFPGSSNKYFIFTCINLSQPAGICYSVVDMNLNGGLGGLISINTPLLTPACEKLSAVLNSNGIDYWVIVHAATNNNFYAYPITTSGVGTAVISSIGLPTNGAGSSIGYLKCSPNGQKIADARWGVTNAPVELFDFNATTGALSNYVPIPNPGDAYGISFSSDNSKLYTSNTDTAINILQYDLTTINFQNFPYSVMLSSSLVHTALQLAPDGKIYCSKEYQNTLGVINNPNLAGAACNYNDDGFTLLSGTEAIWGYQILLIVILKTLMPQPQLFLPKIILQSAPILYLTI